LGLVFGDKGGYGMKKKITYEDAPKGIAEAIESGKKVKDFLPKPEDLILKEDTVKVTLSLNKNSIAFFKKKAKQNKVPYQKMIRRVVDLYAEQFA
jgi:predicted DNA binding CopG/RHH family protein